MSKIEKLFNFNISFSVPSTRINVFGGGHCQTADFLDVQFKLN